MINKVISTHPYLKHKDKRNYKKMHAVFTGVSQRTVVEIEDPADSCEEACAISTDDEHPDCAEETVSRVFPSTSRSTSHGCKSTCCQVLEQNSPFQPTDKHVLKSTEREQGSRHGFFFTSLVQNFPMADGLYSTRQSILLVLHPHEPQCQWYCPPVEKAGKCFHGDRF